MSKSKKIIIAIVIIAVVGGFIFLAVRNVSSSQVGSGIPRNAIPVEIELSRKETIVSKINVKGVVEFVDVERVYSETQGTVKKVHVKAGDEVKAGQRLLDYDEDVLENLENQMSEARLALKSARLSLSTAQIPPSEAEKLQAENARNNYNNIKMLYEAGSASKLELDNAYEAMKRAEDQSEINRESKSNQVQSAQVSVEQAELRIKQIQEQLDKNAGFENALADGTVTAVNIKDGEMSTTGRLLFEIADVSADNIIVTANVPENDCRNLEIGQDAELRSNAVGARIYHGTVSKISAVAEKKQVGNSLETVLTVEIKCGNDAPFRVGYSVDATITTRTIEDTVVVPLMSTIDETDGENYVYIMRDDYSVEKRNIELGEYSGIYVEAGGVAEGERVILNPSAQIDEGVFVKPLAYQTSES